MTIRDKRQAEFANVWLKEKHGILNLCPRFGKIRTSILVLEKLRPKSVLIAYPDNKIKESWQSDFDDSMYDAYSDYGANSILKDPRRWQKKTKKDPDWVPNGRILKKCTQSFQNFCNLDLHN